MPGAGTRPDLELQLQEAEADVFDQGPRKIAWLEWIIGQADESSAMGAGTLALRARLQLIWVYLNPYPYSYPLADKENQLLTTFDWCLATWQRDRQRFRESDIRLLQGYFPDIVKLGLQYPSVTLARLTAILDDMQWYYSEVADLGAPRAGRRNTDVPRAVHACRNALAAHIGDLGAAEWQYQQWAAAPADDRCLACDLAARVAWLVTSGQDAEAVMLAEPVLAGQLGCDHAPEQQPEWLLAKLMLPLARLGQLRKATNAQQCSYLRHSGEYGDAGAHLYLADHFEYLAMTNGEQLGLELLQRHIGAFDLPVDPYSLLRLVTTGAALAGRLASGNSGGQVLSRPPAGHRPPGQIGLPDLANELRITAQELAARFDARNGTNYQSARVRAALAFDPVAR